MATKRTAEKTPADAVTRKRSASTSKGNTSPLAEGNASAGSGSGRRGQSESKAAKSRRVLLVLACLIIAAFVVTVGLYALSPSSASGSTFHFSQKGIAFAAAGVAALFLGLLAVFTGLFRYLWAILALPFIYIFSLPGGEQLASLSTRPRAVEASAAGPIYLFATLALLYIAIDAAWHYIKSGEATPNIRVPDQMGQSTRSRFSKRDRQSRSD